MPSPKYALTACRQHSWSWQQPLNCLLEQVTKMSEKGCLHNQVALLAILLNQTNSKLLTVHIERTVGVIAEALMCLATHGKHMALYCVDVGTRGSCENASTC